MYSAIMSIKSGKKPQAKPIVTLDYNTRTEQSYLDNELPLPDHIDGPERYFLLRAAGSDHPIVRTDTHITRLWARDQKSEKKERKEYLIYREKWTGKNKFGQKLGTMNHLEGKYYEQELEPKIDGDDVHLKSEMKKFSNKA